MQRKDALNKTILLALIFLLFLPLVNTVVIAESSALDSVVVLETRGDYDEQAAAEMKERIGKIPLPFLKILAQKGIVIKLINFPLTDLDEYAYLKGEVPRGWEDTGYTWDDVPGAGGDPTVAKIGYSEPLVENFHDSLNLELHEIAHAIDQFVFNEVSYGDAFVEIHQAEKPLFLPDEYFEYPEEYFAEVFAYYYLREETRVELKENAPRTYQFIEDLPMFIPDTTPPTLILNGPELLKIDLGDDYVEEGAIALDDVYGDLSYDIKVSGKVDTEKSGEYEINYEVKNDAGETSEITRLVRVIKSKISDYISYKKDFSDFSINNIGKLK